MTQPDSISIPIEYRRTVQLIEAECIADPEELTLRELVEAVAEFSDSEREVVATVMHMLRSGAVRLHGMNRGMDVEPLAAKLCG